MRSSLGTRSTKLVALLLMALGVPLMQRDESSIQSSDVGSIETQRWLALEPAVTSPSGVARWLDAESGETPVAAASMGSEDRLHVPSSVPGHGALAVVETLSQSDEVLVVCSGTIVGTRAVLTAAHCLWSSDPDEEPAARVRITPGKDGFEEPWGTQTSTQWMVPTEFKGATSQKEQFQYDFALVLLPDSSMTDRTGAIPGGLSVLSDQEFGKPSLRLAAVGYPYDCNDRVCGDEAHGSLYGLGDHAWLAPSTSIWASANLVYHDADQYDGMSGGPVLRASDLAVTGIISGHGPFLARAVRLTQPVVDRLVGWCQLNGCSLKLTAEPTVPSLPHRTLAVGVAADSSTNVCGSERTFLEQLARAGDEWTAATLDFGEAMEVEDFDPGSRDWRERFERAYAALVPATNGVVALMPPDARFDAYHREIDEGLDEFSNGLALLKRGVDENSVDDFWEGLLAVHGAFDHLSDAEALYPGLESSCLAPLGSPFGLSAGGQ